MKKLLITFFIILFCLTSSIGWTETMDDLIKKDTIYYKKFTEVPFTGKIDGKEQGSMKNGKREGSWVRYLDNGQLNFKGDYKNGMREGSWIAYWDNGQLQYKGNYKNGKKEGSWVDYNKDGTIKRELTGTFKNDEKISD